DDLGEDEVHPGGGEGGQDGVDDDGLGKGQGDLGEDLPAGAAVQHGGLVQVLGDGVKEALGDLEAQGRAARVAEDQSQTDVVALGHAHGLQDAVDGHHGHEAGGHGQDHGNLHVGSAQ